MGPHPGFLCSRAIAAAGASLPRGDTPAQTRGLPVEMLSGMKARSIGPGEPRDGALSRAS